MNHNLANCWGDNCSPPQTPFLSFYSFQSENMMFNKGGEIKIICQSGLRSVGLNWSLHHNMVNKAFLTGKAKALPANRFEINLSPKDLLPGFYDLHVSLDTGVKNKKRDKLTKRPIVGRCTFGWQADKMAIRDSCPADFKNFWTKAKKEIDAIPLDVKYETEMKAFKGKEIDEYNQKHAALPGDYDSNGHKHEEVESCKVSFAGPDGGRVYGWLAKPKGEGPFPVMLVLPGAGFGARPRPLEHARHGYLTLDIQVHGQDVDLPGEYPRIDGHHENQAFEPVEKYYYYNVHKRVMQTVNYLVSRPDVDTKRIVVVGGSQGGRLSTVIAGIDSRITAMVTAIAHNGNIPHFYWVTECNKIESDGMNLKGAPPAVDTPESKCLAYYDTMNFAPDVKCPVLMNGGLIDPVSPPYSVWAVYNRLQSDNKKIVPVDGHGHDWFAEFDRQAWKWLDKLS